MLFASPQRLSRAIYTLLAVILGLATLVDPRLSLEVGSASAGSVNLAAHKIAPALLAQMQANPLQRRPVIVEMQPARPPFADAVNVALANQALAILQLHGRAFGGLPIVNGAAGYAHALEISAISLIPNVRYVHQDATVGPREPSTTRPKRGTPTSSLYTREVKADRVWPQGWSGRGVTVAVLDSGVARDTDLTAQGNRILASISFADAQNSGRPDAGGHGTHIAGTIAGDGTRSARQFVGIAPRANIVDVKVLDAQGRGRVSSVLAGLQWVLSHKDQYNIRVVNLSLGATPLGPSYYTDVMAAGVEVAWRNGLVVVAASGNTGPEEGDVESPGIDPYIITAGATDDQVTLQLADDLVGWFSGWGTPTLSTPKPDLVAPGRQVVAPRVVGSSLDVLLPDHVVTASNGSKYFRLTGTSMSTAVISGAAALLLERRPSLYPDQVKGILVAHTQPFGAGGRPPGAGSGLLDAYRTTNASSTPTHNRGLRPADSFARVLYPILYGQPLVWRDPNYLGRNWSALTWATLEWAAPTWDNIAWDNIAWDNIAWDNIAWDNIAWDNIAWDNIAWDNIAWDNVAWD